MSANCTFQIEKVAQDHYRATSMVFPDLEGSGLTEDEACRALNEAIDRHLRRQLGEEGSEATDYRI